MESTHPRSPPGPPPLPIVGNLPALLGDKPHQKLAELAHQHGDVMSIHFGTATSVVVSSAAAAREVLHGPLSTRWSPATVQANDHAKISMPWLPCSSKLWTHLRAVTAAHLFSPLSLDAGRAVRERKVRNLIDYYRTHAGEPVAVARTVFGAVLNIVSNALFSEDVVTDLGREPGAGGGKEDMRDIIEDCIQSSGKTNVSDLFPCLAGLDLQGQRRDFGRKLDRVYAFFKGVVDRRINSSVAGAATRDFLDALLDLESKKSLHRHEIIVLLTDLFIAGAESSAVTVEWTMAELLRHPAKMAAVRAELEREMGKEKTAVTEDDIGRLPYVGAAMKEAMRLHPPAPMLLPHGAAEVDVALGGFTVPKGTRVLINAWAVMRDDKAWPEANEFKPERFLATGAADLAGTWPGFIPLGSGQRVCPGWPLATRVVPLVLASMLRAFQWRLPDGVTAATLDVSEKFGTGLAMVVPLRAVPSPAE